MSRVRIKPQTLSVFTLVVAFGCTCGLTFPAVAQPAPAADGSAAAVMPLYPLDLVVDPEGVAFVVDRYLPGVWQRKDEKLSVLYQGKTQFRTPLNAARCIALEPDGSLLVGDSATRDIYRIDRQGKAEPITQGKIGIPMDIAVKPDGTIYVADLELRMLLRIPSGTSDVEQVASVNPRGVTVDPQGRVWVISQDVEQVQIISDDGGKEVIVGERIFEFPHQIVVSAAGEAFISDGYRKAIWKISPGGEPEVLFEGEPLDNPVGLALVDGRLLIVDPRVRTVFRLNEENVPQVWFELERK